MRYNSKSSFDKRYRKLSKPFKKNVDGAIQALADFLRPDKKLLVLYYDILEAIFGKLGQI